jgi:hypothetical protein
MKTHTCTLLICLVLLGGPRDLAAHPAECLDARNR